MSNSLAVATVTAAIARLLGEALAGQAGPLDPCPATVRSWRERVCVLRTPLPARPRLTYDRVHCIARWLWSDKTNS